MVRLPFLRQFHTDRWYEYITTLSLSGRSGTYGLINTWFAHLCVNLSGVSAHQWVGGRKVVRAWHGEALERPDSTVPAVFVQITTEASKDCIND